MRIGSLEVTSCLLSLYQRDAGLRVSDQLLSNLTGFAWKNTCSKEQTLNANTVQELGHNFMDIKDGILINRPRLKN